jgi:hypothetical protein
MGTSEPGAEGEPNLGRIGSTFVIRLFAVFALMFGLAYLGEGISTLIVIPSGRYSSFVLLIQLALTFSDLVFGMASIVIGAGLFFRKEWARKAWLVLVILTLVAGLHLTAMQILADYSNLGRVYGWIGLLIFVSAISWAYLTKAPIKASFR